MDDHPDPMTCGHSAVDQGEYIASGVVRDAHAALAAHRQQEGRGPLPEQPERHWSLDDDEAVQALMDRDMED